MTIVWSLRDCLTVREIAGHFPYLAVALEMVDSDGDGVRVLLDLPASLDLALRVSVAVARLRRLTP